MKLDILAFGAHPDDVELGCSGTISKAVASGKNVGIVDLTIGEMGTRGTIETRAKEADASAKLLGVAFRENMNFKDAFIFNDEYHQRKVISVIRKYAPEVVLCNAVSDRHTDHAKAAELVSHACFLSGLQKIETLDDNGALQEAFRPHHVFHYIQWDDLTPDIVINITGHLDKKIAAVFTFGREDLIPDMFISMIRKMNHDNDHKIDQIIYYFERHIEVDGDTHGPMALEMIKNLCGTDPIKWDEAITAAQEALQRRIALWDGINHQIIQKEKTKT